MHHATPDSHGPLASSDTPTLAEIQQTFAAQNQVLAEFQALLETVGPGALPIDAEFFKDFAEATERTPEAAPNVSLGFRC